MKDKYKKYALFVMGVLMVMNVMLIMYWRSQWIVEEMDLQYEDTENACYLATDILSPEKKCLKKEEMAIGASTPHNLRYFNSSLSKKLRERKNRVEKWKGEEMVASMHIQKTAGTSLEMMISNFCCDHFTNKFCSLIFYNFKYKALTQCDQFNTNNQAYFLNQVRIEYNCGYHPSLAQLFDCANRFNFTNQIRFITEIRDPVKRVTSEYYHLRDSEEVEWTKTHGVWDYSKEFMANFTAKFPTIFPFVDHPLNKANNRQSRALLESVWNATEEYDPYSISSNRWLELYGCEEEEFQELFNSHAEEYSPLLEDILSSQFLWVGSPDLWCESIVIFNYIFDVDLPLKQSEVLVSKTPKEFNHPLVDRFIRDRNKVDLMLYEYVFKKIRLDYKQVIKEVHRNKDICGILDTN